MLLSFASQYQTNVLMQTTGRYRIWICDLHGVISSHPFLLTAITSYFCDVLKRLQILQILHFLRLFLPGFISMIPFKLPWLFYSIIPKMYLPKDFFAPIFRSIACSSLNAMDTIEKVNSRIATFLRMRTATLEKSLTYIQMVGRSFKVEKTTPRIDNPLV